MTSRHLQIPVLGSVLAAVVTLILKSVAYLLTGSVGLLSDAAESIVNLLASLTALASLCYAARPVDSSHTYGHEKIEFFSSGLEGMLILIAAGGIAWCAIERLLHPAALQSLDIGLAVSLLATIINAVAAWNLLRVGKAHRSIVLQADGQHLLTDVWTSVAVMAGIGVVALTGFQLLDPLIALAVAANIIWTGVDLVRRSFNGLMDHALPAEEQEKVRAVITKHLAGSMDFHAVRTRQAGARRFADFHLLVPGALTVQEAHELTCRIEDAIKDALPGIEVTVHIEPIEARSAWEDSELLPIERALRPAPSGKDGAEAAP